MGEIVYPRRDVIIQGQAARGLFYARNPNSRRELETMSVKTIEDAALALGDLGNEHHCPLCNDFFPTLAFVAHASRCIQARAPRVRTWTPANFSTNAIVSFKDKVRMD